MVNRNNLVDVVTTVNFTLLCDLSMVFRSDRLLCREIYRLSRRLISDRGGRLDQSIGMGGYSISDR